MAILFQIEGTVAQGTLIRDAVCDTYNYQPFLPDSSGVLTVPNPESKAQYAKSMINTYIKDIVKAYRVKEAEATRLAKISQAETETTGIVIN